MFRRTLLLTLALLASGCSGGGGGGASIAHPPTGSAPVILVEPKDDTVPQGWPAVFYVEAQGTPTPTIQWFRNGSAVPGAVYSSLRFTPTDASLDGASIHATLANSAGSATTRTAILHVPCADAPKFVGQSASAHAFPGALVSFWVSTIPAATVTWTVNGVACRAGTTTFDLGGTSTEFTVDDDRSTGVASTIRFLAPGAPGTYSIQALARGAGVTLPSEVMQLTVTRPSPDGPRLQVKGVLLNQGIQLPDGSVPLVAGRPGLLRVIGAASEYNLLTPVVRVGVTVPGQAPVTFVIPAPGSGVPVAPDVTETPSQTWDVMLPAALVQPDAQVSITLDPGGRNVTHPAWTLPCAPVPDLNIRFIPLAFSGAAPALEPPEVQSYLDEITRLHPLAKVVGSVGAPFTPSVPDLSTPDRLNQVLFDLEAKRIADGAFQTYYQGIWSETLRVPRTGIGFYGAPGSALCRTSLIRSGEAESSAHELGHNFGLRHAPCGAVVDADPGFPYSNGLIGLGQPVDITGPGLLSDEPEHSQFHDLMSYCGEFWISDYHYTKVLDARNLEPGALGPPGSPSGLPSACLLVSGFQNARGWELRPAFRVTGRPSAPAGSGPRIDLLDGDRVLSSRMVEQTKAGEAGRSSFVALIPIAEVPVTGIRLTLGGRSTFLPTLAGQGMVPNLTPLRPGLAHLSWNHATHPAAMVRDEETGEVVALLGGEVQELAVAPGHAYRVELSHGLGLDPMPGSRTQ